MKITVNAKFAVVLVFDDIYVVNEYENEFNDLNYLIQIMKIHMKSHNFKKACIIDAHTGEVLVEAEEEEEEKINLFEFDFKRNF